MTPKEKAKELYLKYSEFANEEYPHTSSVNCALIAVNEIIKSGPYSTTMGSMKEFWQEVKTELEKL